VPSHAAPTRLVAGSTEVPCPRHHGGAAMLQAAIELPAEVMRAGPAGQVAGICVCTARWVDREGVVRQTVARVQGWQGTPLAASFAQVLQLPACAPNDAHPAALGELRFGAGQATDDFVLITLGTGFGGAVVRGGQLAPGATGMAGAIGHLMPFLGRKECRCGARG